MKLIENINEELIEDKYDHQIGKGFKRLLKNFTFLTSGKITENFVTLILFVVISRNFGQEGIGQYSFADK